jgi:hypothetical protein
MAAFPTFKTKDEIPKGFESVYEEKDGVFVAKLPDLGTIEQTLATVRQEKKAAEKQAKEAGEREREALRQLDVKNATGADTDKKVAEMLAKWETDKNSAVKAVQDQLDATAAKLRDVSLFDKAKAAFIAAGGRPERADAALKLNASALDLVDDRIVVKDETGAVTTQSVADFWGKAFRAEMPEYFAGTKATGGGAGGGRGTTPVSGGAALADLVTSNPMALLRQGNE